MRILITGSNGLLGQKIISQLLESTGSEFLATSLGHNRNPDLAQEQYLELDITDAEQIANCVADFRPDCIINTAAMTNVDACESNKTDCWSLNVKAVDNLIRVCNKFNVHLIHLSTDFIFDGENGPYKEEDKPSPLSFYGLSKFASEKLVQSANINWSILRTVLVYGYVENMSRSNIVLWAKQALENKQEMNVVNDQFRTPTLAEDLADACLSAAHKKKTGIYNVSGKDFMSIDQLIFSIADKLRLSKSKIKTISSTTLNQAAKRPPRTGFVIEKAKNELDYSPHSFEVGLELVFSQLRRN